MKIISNTSFGGERPLYGSTDTSLVNVTFTEGESPLKECSSITLCGCTFGWKYPLWYCHDVKVTDTLWKEMARAGVWYSDNIRITDCTIDAPKNFRRSSGLDLERVKFTNAAETLWNCSNVKLTDVTVSAGDYLAMNSRDIVVKGLELDGNYAFDGCSNAVIEDSRLNTKDAFWNCSNVTVRNSHISGEYLGWNSSDLTFIGCTIESSQGLCYINNLKMKDCRLVNTTLAFEYSSVTADIDSDIDSVLNPSSGSITCRNIKELIIEPDRVDPSRTVIRASVGSRLDRPEWL